MIRRIGLLAALLLLLALQPLGASERASATIPLDGAPLQAIELRTFDAWGGGSPLASYRRDGEAIRAELDLGVADRLEIILHPAAPGNERLRIRQQYETSLTLMDEGPHMDLLDWTHFVSPWVELEATPEGSFIMPIPTSSKFPAVNTEEIVAAVETESAQWEKEGYQSGERWINLARQCRGPNDYPCGVGLSLIRLNIEVLDQGAWRTLERIELSLPMGC
ncbi:hypothetical protein DESUT3_33250 [Desulfuromonas versatilis]|uniref:DUF2330 domain-containing protein n=1 Tax=Desulfuromonas versatilis TaxID=2802975 RepID=A0ABN6E1N6_9BACT|nr:hypothetical protein [Desulfuromonas versatilis]BCR06256.1 hypothetical protein DESUT3_33250 [Desulfuromonas versatilis]